MSAERFEVPDDMVDEHSHDDHLVAELLGGTSRSAKDEGTTVANIAGIGRTMPQADFYKPHKYAPTAEGLLGAPCLFCGGSSGAPPHVEWDKMQQEPEPLPEGQIRVQAIDDKVSGNVIRIEIDNPPTEEARNILVNILPSVLEAWLKKNADYGDSDDLKSLGARAEFVRLWNKMMKLKASLWEGRELSGEQPPEIMGDMVAHLLLALSRLKG
jgi:hypothetical protein